MSSFATTGSLTTYSGTANSGNVFFGSDGDDYLNFASGYFRFYIGGSQTVAFGSETYIKMGGTLYVLSVDGSGFVKAAAA
jgi:hypothetical protein